MEQLKPTVPKHGKGVAGQDGGDCGNDSGGEVGGPQSDFDFSIDRSLGNLLRATTNIISSAEQVNRLIAEVATERDRMMEEVTRARRERELLTAYARELKVATEVEVAEIRDRARRESQAILAEAQLVRARAQENAKRLESRLLTAEKRTRVILKELLSTADAAEATLADLELDSKHYSVETRPQPSSKAGREQFSPPAAPSEIDHPRFAAPEENADSPMDSEPSRLDRFVGPTTEDRGHFLSLLTDEDGQRGEYLGGGPTATVALDESEQPIEAPSLESEALPAESSQPTAALSQYHLFVHPVHGFSKVEEIEGLLTEIQGVEGVSLTSLQSQGVVFEVLATTSRDDFLAGVTSRVPDSRIVKADQTEVDLELVHSGGA